MPPVSIILPTTYAHSATGMPLLKFVPVYNTPARKTFSDLPLPTRWSLRVYRTHNRSLRLLSTLIYNSKMILVLPVPYLQPTHLFTVVIIFQCPAQMINKCLMSYCSVTWIYIYQWVEKCALTAMDRLKMSK